MNNKIKLAVLALLLGGLSISVGAGGASVVYTDIANIFTSNQRINAGLGINIAPGATGSVSLSDKIFERSRSAALGDATTYSPTWTGSVSNPAIGNGTITASYVQIGSVVRVSARIHMGSLTTFGSGTWSLSLPLTAAASSGGLGVATMVKSGGNNFTGAALQVTTTTLISIYNGSANNVDANNPFVWGSGDNWTIEIIYTI